MHTIFEPKEKSLRWLSNTCGKAMNAVFQGRPSPFQQDNAKPHTPSISRAQLHSRKHLVHRRKKNTPETTQESGYIYHVGCVLSEL